MKAILISLLLLCTVQVAKAQLLSPDFNLLDYHQLHDSTNTDSWHLFDLLDQGKVVYLYIFSPCSDDCWDYHVTQQLQNFYNAHGPDGDNTAMILGISGGGIGSLLGYDDCSSNNWINGTPYPIIYHTDYNISGIYVSYLKGLLGLNGMQVYSSVYRICPDRNIYRLDYFPTVAEMEADMAGCQVATQPRDVKMLSATLNTLPDCPDEERYVTATIANMGTQPLTSCDIRREYNNHWPHTYHWTGNLPTYHYETVVLDSIHFYGDSANVHLIAQNPNGLSETNHANDTMSFVMSGAKRWDSDNITVELLTDGYGPQLYWDIKGEDGITIDSGGNVLVAELNGNGAPIDVGTSYNDNYHYEETIPLTGNGLGCVTIRVLSGFGYGVCCDYGAGYVRFKQGDSTMFEFTNFGRRAYGKFVTTWVATDEVVSHGSLKAYPNPTDGQINVSFNLHNATDVGIEVYNIMGQRVFISPQSRYMSGSQTVNLALPTLPNGLYWAVLRTRQGAEAIRFVVAK